LRLKEKFFSAVIPGRAKREPGMTMAGVEGLGRKSQRLRSLMVRRRPCAASNHEAKCTSHRSRCTRGHAPMRCFSRKQHP
jgi:hypothetical protein